VLRLEHGVANVQIALESRSYAEVSGVRVLGVNSGCLLRFGCGNDQEEKSLYAGLKLQSGVEGVVLHCLGPDDMRT
jgi:hypothetical protein